MPHIHTQPGQHDMTVSAYIIRQSDGEWQCLVHMHKKIGKLMQVGGHIELDETPWQSLAQELEGEAGYVLSDVDILQPLADMPAVTDAVVHPVPFLENTHDVGGGHYHSDRCFGLIARNEPSGSIAEGESTDLRWLTLDELDRQSQSGEVLQDTYGIYAFLIANIQSFHSIAATTYSLAKPDRGITYLR